MKLTKKILALLLTLVLSLGMFTACAPTDSASSGDSQPAIAEDGSYTSKDEVALYIHTYGHLPENYITKDEAYDLGWKSEGTLDEVAPGMSIGATTTATMKACCQTSLGANTTSVTSITNREIAMASALSTRTTATSITQRTTTTALNICTEMMNDAGDHH